MDDFYISSQGLVMLETTNSIFNNDLYDFVVPHTVETWMRVRVAMALATTGREWGELMARHNSGTYNNMYMVIDIKLCVL